MKRTLTAALALAIVAAIGTPASAGPRGTAEAPDSLKVGGQAADALVDSPDPVLSWAPNDSGRGEAQTAYG